MAAIKRAYYVAAVRWHPDRKGGSSERFKQIKAAYEACRDDRMGLRNERTGRSAADRKPEPVYRRPWSDHGGRADENDGWGFDDRGAREFNDERARESAPDYAMGPRTKEGRWIWNIALGFITARVILLIAMKLSMGGDQEPELQAAATSLHSDQDALPQASNAGAVRDGGGQR
ncbi:hypothetical protein T492DRAFT_1062597 [Pavlovales sp. CCMP2436]|nr:hypothetical protein T492DRAFT_1062597 [Pavlovales sp. CCMP2436]